MTTTQTTAALTRDEETLSAIVTATDMTIQRQPGNLDGSHNRDYQLAMDALDLAEFYLRRHVERLRREEQENHSWEIV